MLTIWKGKKKQNDGCSIVKSNELPPKYNRKCENLGYRGFFETTHFSIMMTDGVHIRNDICHAGNFILANKKSSMMTK